MPSLLFTACALAGALVMTTFGCAAHSPISEGGLNSPEPAARLYAINRAAEQNDHAALPELVDSLASDDPAVRMMAVSALRHITGLRLGYNPYGTLSQRQHAALKWAETVAQDKTD